jgi:hypothetical protein
MIIGILGLIRIFSGLGLFLLLIYVILVFLPNFLLRPRICAKCKQGEIGCPVLDNIKKK